MWNRGWCTAALNPPVCLEWSSVKCTCTLCCFLLPGALAENPRLLLLDELTTFLDVGDQVGVRARPCLCPCLILSLFTGLSASVEDQ